MANITSKTRKPCNRLLRSDIKTFPIWKFADDEESIPGRDETWVRPVNRKSVPRSNSTYSVAARFVIANSLQFSGVAWINPSSPEFKAMGGTIL